MTRKTKLSLLSGVAAVVALGAVAGMANAQMMGEGGWMPMWGHGPHPMMDRLFDRYDANKDGKVTQDEINQTRTGEFNEADPSKTGVITIDQFQQIWLKQHHLQMVRAFQRLDTKGDGKVTLDEYLAPTAGLVAKLPGVKDGAITRDELMKAMRERMHEHMGAMGGGWGHGPGAHGMMGEGGGHMGWGPPPGGPGMGQGGPQGNHGWSWGPPPGGPGMGQPGQQGMNRGWGWGRGWWGQGNGNMQQGQNGWQGQGNWQGQNGHMTENSGGDDSFDGNMVPPGSDAGAMQPPPVPQQGQGN